MIVIRGDVLRHLLSEKRWADRLEEAKTDEQVEKVLSEFCNEKGYKVFEASMTVIDLLARLGIIVPVERRFAA